MSDEVREQIIQQCKAVAHLADALSQVHTDYANHVVSAYPADMLDMVGRRTAHFMEVLGNILNGLDAVDEADEWLDPVFKEAQRRWPPPTDASLIVAAPDLLAVLQEIVDYSGGADHALDDPYVMERVRAAIAKAKAESSHV